MGSIVLLSDRLDRKQQKEKELVQYRRHLEALQVKLDFLRQQVSLTEKIIKLIEREEIVEINRDK